MPKSSLETIRDSQTDRRVFSGLLLGLAGAVFLTLTGWAYRSSLEWRDQQYLALITEQQTLTERIAARSFEVSNALADELANRQTFNELARSIDSFSKDIKILKEGNPESGLSPVSSTIQARVDVVAEAWTKAQPKLQSLLSVRSVMPGARAYQAEFQSALPLWMADLETLLDQMRVAHIAPEQVNHTLRLALDLQQMHENINVLFSGIGAPEGIPKQLTETLARLGDGLQALSEGSRTQGISALPAEGPMRDTLTRLSKRYSALSQQVDFIAANGLALHRANRASHGLALDLAAVQQGLTQQELALHQFINGRFMQPLILVILSGISLVLIVLVVYRLVMRVRQLLAQARRMNQKNQDAILHLLDEMGDLAEGDLSVQATVTADITGAIADAVNYAIEQLRELVRTINQTAERVAASVTETQDVATRLLVASERQSGQIETTTSAIQSMAQSIEQVSDNAQRSSKVAQHAVDVAGKGSAAVQRTIEGMQVIREQIQETSKRIKRLGESSQEIGNIVGLINDIAEQTNILALNAAIQASSAGEAGRGFGVVADEVQRLAERSAVATRQIEALVRTIQADTQEAVASMERSTTGVVSGSQRAEDAGNALDEIERVSNQIAVLVTSISEAAQQQTTKAGEMSTSMRAIREVTVQAAKGTRATGQAIGRLAQLATELRRSVTGFKLPN
ncbi:MAG: methyl-accepting chemotaxis protein [Pseudomonadota bacterium]